MTAALDLNAGAAAAMPFAPEASSVMDEMTVGDYSPDGMSLAYHALTLRRGETLRIASLRTGEVRSLEIDLEFVPGTPLRWSPSGRSLLCTTQKGVHLIDVETGKTRFILEPSDGSRRFGRTTVCWSADDRGILYTKEPNEIIYHNLDDHSDRSILLSADSPFEFIVQSALDISRDGRQLAVGGRAKDSDTSVIRIISLDGAPVREVLRLNNDRSFAGRLRWSADGKYIIFKRFGERGLWFVPSVGGEPRMLTFSGLDIAIQDIAIHPDGKQLAVSGGAGRKSEMWALENFLPPLERGK